MTRIQSLSVRLCPLAAVALLTAAAWAASDETQKPQWDLAALSKAPETIPAQEAKVPGLESLYLTGLPYQGKPTKFYAYLGYPEIMTGKVPAVVLVHGGGGTAMAAWVKYWNAKGYVALSLDNEGQVPIDVPLPSDGNGKKRFRHQTIDELKLPWGGGPQRHGSFSDSHLPLGEQWPYHGVAQTLLSLSLLRSLPQVDPQRVGVVGISWGSVLCSLVGGVDPKLSFVVPQYIGGNLMLGNAWYTSLKDNPSAQRWDPANFYPHPASHAQWLWIDGIHDNYGTPPMLTKSWHATGSNSWMTFLPTQGHGHAWGETGKDALKEIYAFADSVTRGTPPLARILATMPEGGKVTLQWKAAVPIDHAQLCFTTEPLPTVTLAGDSRKDWPHVAYSIKDLPLTNVKTLADGAMEASFPLPPGMKAGLINLIDQRGLTVTGDLMEMP